MTPPRSLTPRATYRLQFHAGFGFKDAAAIAPYLRRLGISHVYASPYLKARPGSTHGYDITDHQALNPELGTEADFIAMVQAFQGEGLGQILDFVPNHMGVGGSDNRALARCAGVGPGFRPCRLVRHRLGSRSTLPAKQAADTVPRRPVWGRAQSRQLEAENMTKAKGRWRSGLTIPTSCRSARCSTTACWRTKMRCWIE